MIGGVGLGMSALMVTILRNVQHGKLRKLKLAMERVLERVCGEPGSDG